MAVSALSRHAILKRLVPRLQPVAPGAPPPRVFIMGFPGAGQAGTLGDLNSEASYAGGLGATHMNTVAANEALVHHWAAAGVRAYGLHPGLIATGIRAGAFGSGLLPTLVGGAMEAALRWFAPSADDYAAAITPLLVAPELDAHPGACFGQGGGAILPTPAFADAAYVARWVAELEALEARALSAARPP
jgi:NAD(P)-dependent dehydrogenase (short-subunit alcohol dehydrogenase family)